MASHEGLECGFFPLGNEAVQKLDVGQIRRQFAANLLDDLADLTDCHFRSLRDGPTIYFPRVGRFIHFFLDRRTVGPPRVVSVKWSRFLAARGGGRPRSARQASRTLAAQRRADAASRLLVPLPG